MIKIPKNLNSLFIQICQMAQRTGIIQIGKFSLDLNHILGRGSTSYVYKGFIQETHEPVAIKAINMNQVNNEVTQYLLEAQKKALSMIKNPYVIKTHEIIQQQEYCYIVMQFCSRGTLRDHITKKGCIFDDIGKLGWQEAVQLFRKIITGYIAIMDALFIHRDLKATNILIRGGGQPAIIDFGYCQMIMAKRPTIAYNVGSPSYMSPETYSKNRYSQKSDVWSLGVVFYQMLTGRTLDNGFSSKEYFTNIEHEGKVKFDSEGMNVLCRQVLEMALQINPENRGTAHKLKYIIDKAMIPQMIPQQVETKMKKNHSYFELSSNNVSGEASGLRYIPANYGKNVPKPKEKRQGISQHLKLLRTSQQHSFIGHQHPIPLTPSDSANQSARRQKNNSFLFVKPTQNTPPQNRQAKQSELNLSFRRIPIMKFSNKLQETMEKHTARNNIISLRIV